LGTWRNCGGQRGKQKVCKGKLGSNQKRDGKGERKSMKDKNIWQEGIKEKEGDFLLQKKTSYEGKRRRNHSN